MPRGHVISLLRDTIGTQRSLGKTRNASDDGDCQGCDGCLRGAEAEPLAASRLDDPSDPNRWRDANEMHTDGKRCGLEGERF